MNKIIFSVMILFSTLLAEGQSPKQNTAAKYEAANWKTLLLDHPEKFDFIAPPTPAQTKSELHTLRSSISNNSKKELTAIQYWNSGAPSYRWNQIGYKLIPPDKIDLIMRIPLAWMNIAIYDATVLAWKEKIKYKRIRPHSLDPTIEKVIDDPSTFSYPCEHSVTASAAAYVLAYFLPEKSDSILQLAHSASQSRINAGVQYPSDVTEGWRLGKLVADEVIERAKHDGSTNVYKGAINKDKNKWTGNYAMGITLPLNVPIVIRSADQFRLPPPPDFSNDMKELKTFKRNFNSNFLAYSWAGSGPDLWSDLASQKMFEYRMSDNAPAVARIYALLNIAYHDMAIAVFDTKYTYWGIRPNQYDTTYKSLITTPPFPGYPSGHAAGAATSCAVLSYFFPEDAKQFKKMAQDCANSRFYAGIHFKTDNESALKMGDEIGNYIVETWMKK